MTRSLSAPPVVGRYYSVPCIRWPWLGLPWQWWPVIGPRHEDAEFLGFGAQHYHVDPRFLGVGQRRTALGQTVPRFRDESTDHAMRFMCERMPIARRSGIGSSRIPDDDPPARPALHSRRCTSDGATYEHGGQLVIQRIRAHYAGHRCGGSRGAWVCPHRGASLASVPAVEGVVTCPLHGLRIREADGACLEVTE